jgi:hypothetical protein
MAIALLEFRFPPAPRKVFPDGRIVRRSVRPPPSFRNHYCCERLPTAIPWSHQADIWVRYQRMRNDVHFVVPMTRWRADHA